MTLKEYLKTKENKSKDIAILMIGKNGKVISIEYKKSEIKDISKELLSREYMESTEEEDCMEVWVR